MGDIIRWTGRSLQADCGRLLLRDAVPTAAERALDLARGDRRRGHGSGCPVRVAFVPVGAPRLLDAAVLEQADLGDRVARIVRDHALVSQAAALDVDIRADGITVFGKTPEAFVGTAVVLAVDGAVWVESEAQAEGMGGSAIAHDKVVPPVEAASRAAQDLWALSDPGGRIRQVAATLGVPDASMKVYATAPIGNSMSMPMSTPESIVAPDPPLTHRRYAALTASTCRDSCGPAERSSPCDARCHTSGAAAGEPATTRF